MENDILLKLDGITGESQDAAYGGAIDVLLWGWDVVGASSSHARRDSIFGGCVHPLYFEHYIDRASPSLMLYCLTGKTIPRATLFARTLGGKPQDFLKITMDWVIINSIAMIDLNTMALARERVSLSFDSMHQEYIVPNGKGGSAGTVMRGYDFKRHREL